MAITYVGVSNAAAQAAGTTTTTGTAAVTPTMPTGTAAGDRVFILSAGSFNAAVAPPGWATLVKDLQVGPTGTAPGAGTGRRFVTVYYRDYDGTWTMPSIYLLTALQNSHAVAAITLRKGSSEFWDIPDISSPGQFTANTVNYSAVVPSFTTVTGAMIVGCTVLNDNVTTSGVGLSGQNMTFANVTERADGGTATGNDVRLVAGTADVSAGGTGTITRTGTLSAASEGGTVIIQQRLTTSITATVGAPVYTTASNPSVTPTRPPNLSANTLLLIRDEVVNQSAVANQPSTPSGWTLLDTFTATNGTANIRHTWFWRVGDPGSNPAIALTGTATTQHRAVIIAVHNAKITGTASDIFTIGTQSSPATSSTLMGPITGLTTPEANCAILMGAVRENDITNDASIGIETQQSGFNLVVLDQWGGHPTADNGAGGTAFARVPSAVAVTNKSFTSPHDTALKSIGQMIAIRPLATGATHLGDATRATTATISAGGFPTDFGAATLAATATIGATGVSLVAPTGLGPKPVDLSTQGTVRTANSDATIASQISASAAGDTVQIAAGSYGYITITKSIPSGLIRIVPAAGATVTFAGCWFNGAQGIDVRGINTSGAASGNDNVWFNGSTRCRWRGGAHNQPNTSNAFDIRQSNNDLIIEDVTINSPYSSFNINSTSEADRSQNITLRRFRSNNVFQDHVLLSRGSDVTIEDFECYGNTESDQHSDGVQIVGGKNVAIRRGHLWNDRSFRNSATDRNDPGSQINYDSAETPNPRVPENIVLDSLLVHDQTSYGIGVGGCLGLTIVNCTSYDNGASGAAYGLSIDADPGNTISGLVIANNVFNSQFITDATPTVNTHNFVADGTTPAGTSQLTGAPGFTGSTNYTPTGSSANVHSGSAAYSSPWDLYGVRRGATPSRGAVEPVTVASLAATATIGAAAGATVGAASLAGSATLTAAGFAVRPSGASLAATATATTAGYGTMADGATLATAATIEAAPLVSGEIEVIDWAEGGNGNASTLTLSNNAAMQQGDLWLVNISVTNATITTPTGWNLLSVDIVASTRRIYWFWREHAGGSEAASYVFTLSQQANCSASAFALRGADTTNPVDVVTVATSATSGTSLTTDTITTQTDGAIVLASFHKMAVSSGVSLSVPSGMTSITAGSGNGTAGHAYRTVYQSPGPIGSAGPFTSTATGDSANPWGASILAIKPTALVPITEGASLAATATIGAAGFVERPTGASVATTATATAAGYVDRRTPATVASTATVTAAGFVARPTPAALAVTAGLTAAGFVVRPSGASLASTATLTAAGALALASGAQVAATAAVTSAGYVTRPGGASLAATVTAAAAGFLALPSGATLSGSATVTAAGFLALASGASLAGTASVTADGYGVRLSAATVAGSATIATAGQVESTRAAALALVADVVAASGAGAVTTGAALVGTAAIVVAGLPSIRTLTDDFSTADPAKWSFYEAENIRVTGGALEFDVLPAYYGLESVGAYDARETSADVEILQAPNVGNGSTSAYFMLVRTDIQARVIFLVEAGQLWARYEFGGETTTVAVAPHDGIAHRYLRFRETGGEVSFETSATGNAWSTFAGPVALPFSLQSVAVVFLVGHWQAETAPGMARFDNFNAARSVPTLETLAVPTTAGYVSGARGASLATTATLDTAAEHEADEAATLPVLVDVSTVGESVAEEGAALFATADIATAEAATTASAAALAVAVAVASADYALRPSGAAVSGSATITAAGTGSAPGGAVLSTSATVAAIGLISATAPATLAVTATATVAGYVSRPSAADVTSTATITAAGFLAVASGAELLVTADASTAGTVDVRAAATLAGSVSIVAAGYGVRLSAAALAAAATVLASPTGSVPSAATLAGTAAVSAAGFVMAPAAAVVAPVASVSAAGYAVRPGGALLAVTVSVYTAGEVGAFGLGAVPVTATIVAAGYGVRLDAATLASTATLAAAGFTTGPAPAALAVAAALTAAGMGAAPGGAVLALSAALSAAGVLDVRTGATLVVAASLTAAGAREAVTAAALPATAALTAAGYGTRPAAASVVAAADLTAGGLSVGPGGGFLIVTADLTAAGRISAASTAALAVTGSITAAGYADRPSAVALALTASVTAAGFVERPAGAVLVATTAAVTAGFVLRPSAASLASSAVINAVGVVFAPATATRTATAAITAGGFVTVPSGAVVAAVASVLATPAVVGLVSLLVTASLSSDAVYTRASRPTLPVTAEITFVDVVSRVVAAHVATTVSLAAQTQAHFRSAAVPLALVASIVATAAVIPSTTPGVMSPGVAAAASIAGAAVSGVEMTGSTGHRAGMSRVDPTSPTSITPGSRRSTRMDRG